MHIERLWVEEGIGYTHAPNGPLYGFRTPPERSVLQCEVQRLLMRNDALTGPLSLARYIYISRVEPDEETAAAGVAYQRIQNSTMSVK